MSAMRTLAALALLFALSACAGTPFTWEDAGRVQNGMTEGEVVAIMGKPHARSQSGRATSLMYSFATGFGGAKAVGFTLIDGRVTGQTTVGK